MVILKNLAISVIIGVIVYLCVMLIQEDSLSIPDSTAEFGLLLLFVVAAFASALIAGKSGEYEYSDSSDRTVDDTDREEGTVKWFNVRKGYGFITRDMGEDVFVHFRNIEGKDRRAISEGQRVSFIVTDSEKGLQADKVIPV